MSNETTPSIPDTLVTAWKPSDEEVAAMNSGAPIFLTFIGNALPPHMASVNFAVACHPA